MVRLQPVNVARFLPGMAEVQPDRCALKISRGRARDGTIDYSSYSFNELNRIVDGCGARLRNTGIQRGTRVLVMVKPGLDLIAVFFALFKLGAVPVLIDPGMGVSGFLRCVRRSQPEFLVSIPLGTVLSRLFFPSFRSLKRRITVGSAKFPGGFACTAFTEEKTPELPVANTRPDDLAAILFTSGSTGPAKGVCYEHAMFEAQVEMIRDTYGIQAGEIDLPMLPVFALFNPALGMTTVVPEINPSRPATVDPSRIVAAIRQCGVTNTFGSPVLWRKIGRYCRKENIALPTLKRILIAGAAVSPGLIRDFESILPNGQIHTPYGATESLPVTTISGNEVLEDTWRHTEAGMGSCVGRPVSGVEVRILAVSDEPVQHLDSRDLLPCGETGEIIVKGAVVTKTYDQLPDATAAAKIRDETGGVWHRMGDLGYFDEEGRLWFCGRKAERVVTPEETLYTDCCEAVFNRHPRVHRTALIGLGGERGNQTPSLVVEPEAGHFPSTEEKKEAFVDELRALAADYPPARKIRSVFFHPSFPVDVRHNAKIHRLTLAGMFAGKAGIPFFD